MVLLNIQEACSEAVDMIDGIFFSVVLRGQLPAQSQAETKGEVVSAEDSPGSSGPASDVSTPHLAPEHEGFCSSCGQSPPLTNPLGNISSRSSDM